MPNPPVCACEVAGQWFVHQRTWVKVASGALVATILFAIILLSAGDRSQKTPNDLAAPTTPAGVESVESLQKTILTLESKIKEMTVATTFRSGELDERSKEIQTLKKSLQTAQASLSKETKALAATALELKTLRTDSGSDKLTLAAMTREYEVSCKKQEALQEQITQLKKANAIVADAMGKTEGSNVADLDDVVAAKVVQATKELTAKLKTLTVAQTALDAKNKTLAAEIVEWTKKQATWDAREKTLLASTAGANAAELKKTIAAWQTKLTQAEMAQTAAEKKQTDLETQLEKAKGQLAQSKSFRDELDAEIAAMAAEKKIVDDRQAALKLKQASTLAQNTKLTKQIAALKVEFTNLSSSSGKLTALQTQLTAQAAMLKTAHADVATSRAVSKTLLNRMLLLYMGPPQAGVSRLAMLQTAIKRNRLAARGQSLKTTLTLQPKAVVSKVDALLTQLTLLDDGDVRSVVRFRETLAKSGVESQMVELASAKTASPAMVAYLTEAQLIFAAMATA